MFAPKVTKVLNEVKLTKRSKKDKIATFSAKQLKIKATKNSCWRVSLYGGVDITVRANRSNGTSLTVDVDSLPRYVKLPRVGVPTKVYVVAVERLF